MDVYRCNVFLGGEVDVGQETRQCRYSGDVAYYESLHALGDHMIWCFNGGVVVPESVALSIRVSKRGFVRAGAFER